ncbi:hypothetical protein ACJX0J_015294, partial [Zea mays]
SIVTKKVLSLGDTLDLFSNSNILILWGILIFHRNLVCFFTQVLLYSIVVAFLLVGDGISINYTSSSSTMAKNSFVEYPIKNTRAATQLDFFMQREDVS